MYLLLIGVAASAQNDADGCKDHELIPNRIPGYFIENCVKNDFSEHVVVNEKKEEIKIEGKKTVYNYRLKQGGTGVSEGFVRLNYMDAIKKQGGKITLSENGRGVAYAKKNDGTVVWVDVAGWIGDGSPEATELYILTIVEIAPMEQVITAQNLGNDLKNTGKAVLYIQFETGKSTIQQESYPIIEQMAGLLNANPGMKVFIVGHTDNVGTLENNMKLSEERALAVMNALVGQYKVNVAQLISKGVGPLSPLASNDTEDGKKLNRRVEMVKQ
jgi:outer membrane protein OmpA-like peptidoglycan-associated protein